MKNIKFYLTITLLNTASLTPSFSMEKEEDEKQSTAVLVQSEREIIAVKNEDAKSQVRLGRKYMFQENKTMAFEWYEKAANNGHPEGQFWLGDCYEHGRGVERDLNKAVKWYKKAAAQEYIHAQLRLGECYEHGRGVEQDLNEAFQWYMEAAVRGDISAQLQLGKCYENGRGVKQDLNKAVEWYEKAAKYGDEGQFHLNACRERIKKTIGAN